MKTIKPYPNIVLNFDEERHQFTIGDRKILSVTAATGVIDKSQALIGWAVKLYKEFLLEAIMMGRIIDNALILEGSQQHRIVKEKAGGIGDIVHEYCEQFALGLKPELPEDEKTRNGALAFMQWVNENKVKFLEAEKLVYSKKHDVAGIIDSICKVNGKLTLLDFKTSKGIWDEHYIQAAGYSLIYEEMTKKKLAQVLILHLDKETGNFTVHEVKNLKESKKAFIAALALKKYLNGKG